MTDPDGGIPRETIRRVMERVDRQMVDVTPEPAPLLPAIRDNENRSSARAGSPSLRRFLKFQKGPVLRPASYNCLTCFVVGIVTG